MAKTAETLYTYGAGLTSETKAEGTYYYHFNNIGSTTEITDTAGAVKYRITYGPYGELTGIKDGNQNPVNIADEAITPFLYNGQLGVQTDQNGLYYMRARYYNTDIKRFINRDTVSGDLTNSQSLNKYSYVQGNPVSLTDPFGLSPMGGDIMSILSQQGHTALDVLGFLWDGFDLINAAWYAAEKNYLMAASCAVSAIPFLGSMVAGGTKLAIAGAKAVKAADCIKEVSAMVGFTGMAVVGAINTAQAYKDYKEAKANGTATFSDELNVAVNALLTVGAGVCALATATKVRAKLKTGGVGDSVKASAGECMSGKGGSKTKGLIDGAPEPEVQNFIERFRKKYPGREYNSGHKLQHSDGRFIEIDFETDNVILEFKRGNGKGLTRQIIDRQDPKINPAKKVVIGVPGSKMSKFAQQDVEKAGGLMSNDIDLILELIKPD